MKSLGALSKALQWPLTNKLLAAFYPTHRHVISHSCLQNSPFAFQFFVDGRSKGASMSSTDDCREMDRSCSMHGGPWHNHVRYEILGAPWGTCIP